MTKRLYKSNINKKLDGVCGGVAEYLNIDPTFVRLIWALLGFTGTGVLAYIVCAVIIPRNPGVQDVSYQNTYNNEYDNRQN